MSVLVQCTSRYAHCKRSPTVCTLLAKANLSTQLHQTSFPFGAVVSLLLVEGNDVEHPTDKVLHW